MANLFIQICITLPKYQINQNLLHFEENEPKHTFSLDAINVKNMGIIQPNVEDNQCVKDADRCQPL